jgi:hypothetical protein
MTPDEIQSALRFLAMVHSVSPKPDADAVRRAIEGPVPIDDLPTSIPWPVVEMIVQAHPTFLDRDPARRLAWDLRESDVTARIRVTKALIDASDNQTLDPVDLLGPDLRASGIGERLRAAADDIADVLTDDFPPQEKQRLLGDILATI